MKTEARKRVINVLKCHGYPRFTKDQKVVRVEGAGRYGERIAVHPQGELLRLWVRRGGPSGLYIFFSVQGGSLEKDALGFRDLDIGTLDTKVGEVRRVLGRESQMKLGR